MNSRILPFPTVDIRDDESKKVRNTYVFFLPLLIGFVCLIIAGVLIWMSSSMVGFNITSLEGELVDNTITLTGSGGVVQNPYRVALELALALLAVGVSVVVFIWTWYSYVNNKQSRELLEQSWHGRQMIFGKISDQVEAFCFEMKRGGLSDVSDVTLMLSTLMYGIQDRDDGPGTIIKLFKTLDDWVDSGTTTSKVLTLGLWGSNDHAKIWSINDYKKGSDWYRDKSPDQITEYLKAFKTVQGFFMKIAKSTNVALEVNQVTYSDMRFFLINRSNDTPFGMVVAFSPFFAETVRQREYMSTGFTTTSPIGVTSLKEAFNLANIAVDMRVGEPQTKDPLISAHTLKFEFSKYVEEFFGLGSSKLGEDFVWDKNIKESAKRVCELSET